MPTNRITKYTFNGNLDFRSKIMSLDTAKHIISHLSSVTGKTIQFSNDMWALIEEDDDAMDILEEAYSRGWNSNEPDIIIIANNGYNGVVRVNGSNTTLTNVSGTDVWIGSAGTVTTLDYFLKHDSRSGTYNSNSVNVKKVRFGKNINTSGCTTMQNAFCSNGSDRTNLLGFDVRHINTQSVTDFRTVFGDCGNDKSIYVLGLEDWNVSAGTNFGNFMTNTNFGNVTFDLHKWHISSNVTNMSSMFGGLSAQALYGYQHKIYYTPGYWGKDPMNNSNLAADRVKPVVYPYHDINIAANSSFSGKATIEGTLTTLSKDNSLGIWYYDRSEGTTSLNVQNMLNYANDSTVSNVISVSFGSDITDNLFRSFRGCSGLRSLDTSKIKTINSQEMLMLNTTNSLTTIYFNKEDYQQSIYGTFANCANILYLDTPKFNITGRGENIFYACSSLRRISNFPGVLEGCTPTNIVYNCTSLTTIDAAGPISETIDFSPCPLTLDSAKVILSALQTVTSETLTFSSATQDLIAGDYEAKLLVGSARERGWNIPIRSTVTGTVTSGTSSVSIRINGTARSVACTNGAFTYTTTDVITSIDNFIYNNNTLLSVDMHRMDLYRCTSMTNVFNSDRKLASINASGLDTRNVTTFQAFAHFCTNSLNSPNLQNIDTSSATSLRRLFSSCQNMVTLPYLPSIPSGCDTSLMLDDCPRLTTIDTCGTISETIDISSAPLSLASAKVILRQLQTVVSETCTFSSTTLGYINNDNEAMTLVQSARNKGWTISL